MIYDNYLFDLYGTLIDIRTDEHSDDTWQKWCGYLDAHGFRHPAFDEFREDFFAADAALRHHALAVGANVWTASVGRDPWAVGPHITSDDSRPEDMRCYVPEIDVLAVYKDLFLRYGNEESFLTFEALSQASYAFRAASRSYARLFPGVEAFLLKLRETGRHAYIVSNAQATYTWPEICMFHLDELTDDQIMSSDLKRMKPDPAFFDCMMRRHHLNPAATVMVGDSEASDIRGAALTGIASIHLNSERPAEEFYLKERL